MTGHAKWATLVLFALTAAAQSQEPVDVGHLQRWLDTARPVVEQMFGHELPRLPRLLVPETLPLYPDGDEILFNLRSRFPHLTDHGYQEAVKDVLAVHQQTVIARYLLQRTPSSQAGNEASIVFFPANHLHMPRWLESLRPHQAAGKRDMQWHDGLKDAASLDFVKLAVVHEVVRYALDSRYQLGRLRESCRDADEWFALQAVIEGRAQWVTQRVAKHLQLDTIFPLLAARYLYVPDVSPDPGLRAISQSVVRQQHWAYAQGLAFWTYLESQGKADEKAVFANLPRQPRMIEQPEAYLRQAAAPRPDLHTVLANLEPQHAASEWASTQQPWTPEMCIQVAGLLNEKSRAEKIVQGWQDGRSVIWSWKNAPECQVALSVVRYESEAGARGYFGFALDLQRKRDELSNQPCGLPLKVIDSRSSNPNLTGVDEAIFFEKKMQYVNSKQTMASHLLLLRKGDRVIEFTWYGMSADTAWAQRILSALPQ
jgi:hypothetical protein